MEITSAAAFMRYYAKVKGRTRRLFPYIPEDKIEWTYQEGKFTIGDLIRHLANIERYMYAETVQLKPAVYLGCGTEYAEGYQDTIDYYERMYEESQAVFLQLKDEDLLRKCPTPGKIEITTWKWLRAMVEHEIHHRGQLYTYLGILGLEVPPIYGLTAEEVAARAKS